VRKENDAHALLDSGSSSYATTLSELPCHTASADSTASASQMLMLRQ